MINAWIIAKETGVKMSRLDFMENVIISLIDDPAPAAESEGEERQTTSIQDSWTTLASVGNEGSLCRMLLCRSQHEDIPHSL